MRAYELLTLATCLTVAAAPAVAAQDANFHLPVEEIEHILVAGGIEVFDIQPSRGLPGERTYRATMQSGNRVLQVKYAPAPEGGGEFNNRPRYELAAYAIQQLFLEEREWVVPPTAIRAFPLDAVQAVLDEAPGDAIPPLERTFSEWPVALVVLQYWLFNVEVPNDLPNSDRLEEEVYERLLGNFNLFTYVVHHSDSNQGNFVQSLDPAWPRVFSVDNGVAFMSEESDRGTRWRELRLVRYPASTVKRLRSVTLEDLQVRLAVLAQFEAVDGTLVRVEPTEVLDPDRGVRSDERTVQLGLTGSEIRNIHRRIVQLAEWVDDGRYGLLP